MPDLVLFDPSEPVFFEAFNFGEDVWLGWPSAFDGLASRPFMMPTPALEKDMPSGLSPAATPAEYLLGLVGFGDRLFGEAILFPAPRFVPPSPTGWRSTAARRGPAAEFGTSVRKKGG